VRLGRTVEAGLFIDDYLSRGGPAAQIAPFREAMTAQVGARRPE
jgi:hypothetical protein